MTRKSSEKVVTYERRDSAWIEYLKVQDTMKEVTAITVCENERGDTIRMTTVTDRTRNRDAIAMQRTKVEARVDTVYIEK